MEPKGNAIIAARLSRKHSNRAYGQGLGIDTQDTNSREYAEREGWHVVEVVPDTKSGTVAPWDRKNLRPWVTHPDKLALYDAVIAFKTDRLSRGTQEDFTQIEHWATQHGKRLIIVDGPQYPARDDSDYWQWAAAKRGARQEWESIQERNVRMQAALIAKGSLVGEPPWGYEIAGEKENKTLVPTDLGRMYVPKIFRYCRDGWSLARICARLDAEGVATVRGQPWQPRTISRMIRCTTYIGYRRNSAGKIVLRCEALVGIGLFNSANEALTKRPKRGPVNQENRAACTSVLFCPSCGGTSPMYRVKGGMNRTLLYYRCTGKGSQRKGCGNQMRLEPVDALVHQAMMQLVRPITMLVFVPGNDHRAELDDIQFQLQQLPSQGLGRAEEQAERERLWAEEDRIKNLKVEAPRTERRETGETYADRWKSLATDAERNDWLKSLGVRIWAWKYDGSDLDPAMREVVARSLGKHPAVRSMGRSIVNGVYHITQWDGSIVINVTIPLASLRRTIVQCSS